MQTSYAAKWVDAFVEHLANKARQAATHNSEATQAIRAALPEFAESKDFYTLPSDFLYNQDLMKLANDSWVEDGVMSPFFQAWSRGRPVISMNNLTRLLDHSNASPGTVIAQYPGLENGAIIKGYHGTFNSGNFEQFDPTRTRDIGSHFGTKTVAEQKMGDHSYGGHMFRNYLSINPNTPIVSDMFSSGDDLLRAGIDDLYAAGAFNPVGNRAFNYQYAPGTVYRQFLDMLANEPSNYKLYKNLDNTLRANGVNALVYRNLFEDGGNSGYSVAMLNPARDAKEFHNYGSFHPRAESMYYGAAALPVAAVAQDEEGDNLVAAMVGRRPTRWDTVRAIQREAEVQRYNDMLARIRASDKPLEEPFFDPIMSLAFGAGWGLRTGWAGLNALGSALRSAGREAIRGGLVPDTLLAAYLGAGDEAGEQDIDWTDDSITPNVDVNIGQP